jgi:hypothetical protein
VRIAVDDCQVSVRMITREQARRLIKQSLVKIAPLQDFSPSQNVGRLFRTANFNSGPCVPYARLPTAPWQVCTASSVVYNAALRSSGSDA